VKKRLDRSQVENISACFYSHWHGDHVLGLRVWEAMNGDLRVRPPENRTTDIYVPEQVARDFRNRLGLWDTLSFFERGGLVRAIDLSDGDSVDTGGTTIRPSRLAEDYVYAFEFDEDGKRPSIAPDEVNGWEPPEHLRGADLDVLQGGVFEFDPFTGERRIHEENPVLESESTFEETLGIVDSLGAQRAVLTHVEEVDGLTHDDLKELGRDLSDEGRNVEFAYDTLVVDV
ncbi:MAG TPA: MBL fold metallo-hydrolase, partial [Rubrobacter sp.]|nr:MBL fold metallo-hydrolase [Rubrobacter sp.]